MTATNGSADGANVMLSRDNREKMCHAARGSGCKRCAMRVVVVVEKTTDAMEFSRAHETSC